LTREELAGDRDEFCADVATRTEGFSGSDLAALVNTAARVPLRELLAREASAGAEESESEASSLRPLEIRDFEEALKSVSQTGEVASKYQSENLRRRREVQQSGWRRDNEETHGDVDDIDDSPPLDVADTLRNLSYVLQATSTRR
jgi:SpoVK/Ycf46/Vps4 family AAA+-type ATPase